MLALGVLACVTLVSVATVRGSLAEWRAARTRHATVQARWLAEAGVERAAARLASDRDYRGETWTTENPAATVTIEWPENNSPINKSPEPPLREFQVTARLTLDEPQAAVVVKRIPIGAVSSP